jgi:hypothetical protein
MSRRTAALLTFRKINYLNIFISCVNSAFIRQAFYVTLIDFDPTDREMVNVAADSVYRHGPTIGQGAVHLDIVGRFC